MINKFTIMYNIFFSSYHERLSRINNPGWYKYHDIIVKYLVVCFPSAATTTTTCISLNWCNKDPPSAHKLKAFNKIQCWQQATTQVSASIFWCVSFIFLNHQIPVDLSSSHHYQGSIDFNTIFVAL